jgi:hypothetical protein
MSFSIFFTWTILAEIFKSLNSSLCSFSPLSCLLVHVRPKYSYLQLMSRKYFYKFYLIHKGNMKYDL